MNQVSWKSMNRGLSNFFLFFSDRESELTLREDLRENCGLVNIWQYETQFFFFKKIKQPVAMCEFAAKTSIKSPNIISFH